MDEAHNSLQPAAAPSSPHVSSHFTMPSSSSGFSFEFDPMHANNSDYACRGSQPMTSTLKHPAQGHAHINELIWITHVDTKTVTSYKKALEDLDGSHIWKNVIAMGRILIRGALATGAFGNSMQMVKVWNSRNCFVTNILLESLPICNTTYTNIRNIPVPMGSMAIGWPQLRHVLANHINSYVSDLRKIVALSLSPMTGFCVDTQDLRSKLLRILSRIEPQTFSPPGSLQPPYVGTTHSQQALHSAVLDIITSPVSKELCYTTLFAPIKNFPSTLAELFPDEVQDPNGYLGAGIIAFIVCLFYEWAVKEIQGNPQVPKIVFKGPVQSGLFEARIVQRLDWTK
ncbi:hypothetical protein BJ138DRAFT_1120890 [Hygrophoropsis aurantiaca]|uniref:Uncharacterized protein n=1 Tax=Hygrophoropsis aurantiaca TaxID=72124 RepID=A0ACB7ZP52_9AGAM|nr:hypothetical protein BJ138DRAFT_1120890 [Hygrophoropsis aurantiaca]